MVSNLMVLLGSWFVEVAMMIAAVMLTVWKVVEWLWLRPWWLERVLRSQGLRGSRYRFLYGDLKDDAKLICEVRKTHIPLSQGIIPRVAPHLHRRLVLYGGESKLLFGWVGPYPRVMIMDPDIVREVFSNKLGHLEKPRATRVGRLLVSGLVSYEGEKWSKHRRIINPAFHADKLKRMMPAFSICCDELISRWEDLAGSSGKCEIDIWPEFQRLTADIISRTAFGSSYKEGRRVFELQKEQAELLVRSAQSLCIPGFRFIPIKSNRRRNEIQRQVDSLLRRMIVQREHAIRKKEASSSDDLLGLLIESNSRYSREIGDHLQGIPLTLEDVIEECKLFYFAGHETTSVLFTWTLIMLAMHVSWQNRAREEVLHLFGQNNPDFEGLSKLKIVTMILYEALRLYPPGITFTRQTCKETKLGEITIPPGVQLLLPIIFIHHSKEFWGEDAEEFKPERFAEGISKATKNRFVFFPFGSGPRICIGQNFALTEAKIGLTRILQRFSVGLSQSYAHAPHMVLTLQPQHGAQVILRRL